MAMAGAFNGNGFHAPHESLLQFGECCACGKRDHTVINLAFVPRKAPVEGTGWGCSLCELPPNGAIAIVCHACIAGKVPIKTVLVGKVGTDERIAIGDFVWENFEHDPAKHPAGDGVGGMYGDG